MIARDWQFLALLCITAIYAWVRDLSWLSDASDVLPVLVAFPAFLWLGWPWRFSVERVGISASCLSVASVLFVGGLITDFNILVAMSWTIFLGAWLKSRLPEEKWLTVRRLMLLPMFGFPWMSLDGTIIGWYFRISGAWTVEHVFAALQFDVTREGTRLVVQGLPFAIESACSGLRGLQSMLIVGTILGFWWLRDRTRYWWHIPMIVITAWLANTLRILLVCVMALSVSPEFASDFFHDFGGVVSPFVMLLLCLMIFEYARTCIPRLETTA